MHIHLKLIDKDISMFWYERSVIGLFEPGFEMEMCPNQDMEIEFNDVDVVKML